MRTAPVVLEALGNGGKRLFQKPTKAIVLPQRAREMRFAQHLDAGFDEGKHVPEAIDSVFRQTFSDFEFIVIDDGSTDNSVQQEVTNQEPNLCGDRTSAD
jgi:hypothetical protein